jgi:hypothetical protein
MRYESAIGSKSMHLLALFCAGMGCSQPHDSVEHNDSLRVSADPHAANLGLGGGAGVRGTSTLAGAATSGGNPATGGFSGTDGTGGSSATGGFGGTDPDSPIVGLQSLTWNWVPFQDAHCRKGASTGIGVNPNPASDKLMILLEGGGACFDTNSCSLNNSAYGRTQFDKFTADTQFGGGAGVFNRNDAANPVKDWNFVFVPYCTGDVHAGNNPDGMIGTVKQQFVGYTNMGLYLRRIAPTFGGVTQVLLTGVSAGGFGALANYVQVAKKFAPVPVTLLDDSGPPMDAPYLAACLANLYLRTWGLDKTVQADCGTDCQDASHLLIDFQKHVVRTYPDDSFGLVDSTGDWVISAFFGYGNDDCAGFALLPAATFTAGLQDIRAHMADQINFGTFVFSGTDHTTLLDSTTFDTRKTADMTLTSYIASLIAGQVSNVGP